ncbi:MFS transporter [Myroides sp. LJL119]
MQQEHIKTNYPGLYTLIIVFFFWGFFAASNSIFIPFCKDFFHLDQFQSQLIDFSFYTAYYLGALGMFLFASITKVDLVSKWGYKNSIVYGLLFSVLGAVSMVIAVQVSIYLALLVGLFIVALGFSLQQIAANPLAIALGDPKTGTSRVSLAGGVNSLGGTIGPLLMAYGLFGSTKTLDDSQIKDLSLDSMTLLYVGVGALFFVASLIFYFSKKIPKGISKQTIEPAKKAVYLLVLMSVCLFGIFGFVFWSYTSKDSKNLVELERNYQVVLDNSKSLTENSGALLTAKEKLAELTLQIQNVKVPLDNMRIFFLFLALCVIALSITYAYFKSAKNPQGWGAMGYPQLLLGMLAIFTYVGVEVAVGSNLGDLLKLEEFSSLQSSQIAPYISMYWGSLMIGRWAAAVSIFNLSKNKRILLLILVPFLAYAVVMFANKLAGNNIQPLYYYSICVAIQIVFCFYANNKSARTMILFSLMGVISIIIGLLSTGMVAIYAFLSAGLACSVLWPAIFNIAIMGLGKYTAQGSSFLIMMILGGGIIPPIQGKVADIIGIHNSYVVSLLCFVYLLFFGFISRKVLEKQNIRIDQLN